MTPTISYDQSFAGAFPELLKYYHPTKNRDLKPSDVKPHSNTTVIWIGPCGHEWTATFNAAANGYTKNSKWGCPYCNGHKILSGFNDFATLYPDKLQYWDRDKNKEQPETSAPHGKAKIWWKGNCGHKWQKDIPHSIRDGFNCPVCSNRKTVTGINDVATKYPDLIAEWNYDKNPIPPEKASSATNRKYWWKCRKGHEWQAVLKNRANGTTCPYCAGQKIATGYNDLQTKCPTIIKHWNYNKNTTTPDKIPLSYEPEIWFMCEKGHEWKERPELYVKRKSYKCPMCAGKDLNKITPKLIDANPDIIKMWHKHKNIKSDLSKLSATSDRRVWWQCEQGHEWKMGIHAMIKRGSCPYCDCTRLVTGINDLATQNPKLAAEWHPEKNGDLTPSQIKPNSSKKVWWQCANGHEWQATVNNRSHGGKCPYCVHRKVIQGQTDFVSSAPELLQEWHPVKNKGINPHKLLPSSQKRIWWKCKNGHEWETFLFARAINHQNCPYCTWSKKPYNGFIAKPLPTNEIPKQYNATCIICGYKGILSAEEMTKHHQTCHPNDTSCNNIYDTAKQKGITHKMLVNRLENELTIEEALIYDNAEKSFNIMHRTSKHKFIHCQCMICGVEEVLSKKEIAQHYLQHTTRKEI